MTSPLSSVGVGSNDSSAGSLALELAHPESMLRRTLTIQSARLRALAATMEEEGKCLKILGTTEKRIPNAFSRGAEMCGAADMARDWAANLEALLPNANVQRRSGAEPASPSVQQPTDQHPAPERSL